MKLAFMHKNPPETGGPSGAVLPHSLYAPALLTFILAP
jgi:hypothetical protein